ncbi:hypothetical protein [Jutongia sp.]
MRKRIKQYFATMVAISLLFYNVSTDTYLKAATKVSLTKTAKVEVGKKVTLNLKNNKKPVKWNVSKGSRNLKIVKKTKTSCTVKGMKKGSVNCTPCQGHFELV